MCCSLRQDNLISPDSPKNTHQTFEWCHWDKKKSIKSYEKTPQYLYSNAMIVFACTGASSSLLSGRRWRIHNPKCFGWMRRSKTASGSGNWLAKQMFWCSQHRIEFVAAFNPGSSSKICTGADGTFFSIHALLLFSLSAIPPSPDESRALSSFQVSLFSSGKKRGLSSIGTVATRCRTFWCAPARDGSESSPVSFRGSPNVDFEPQSVKLGLIATRGAARFGVRTRLRKEKKNTERAFVPKMDRLSWQHQAVWCGRDSRVFFSPFHFWRRRVRWDMRGAPNVSVVGRTLLAVPAARLNPKLKLFQNDKHPRTSSRLPNHPLVSCGSSGPARLSSCDSLRSGLSCLLLFRQHGGCIPIVKVHAGTVKKREKLHACQKKKRKEKEMNQMRLFALFNHVDYRDFFRDQLWAKIMALVPNDLLKAPIWHYIFIFFCSPKWSILALIIILLSSGNDIFSLPFSKALGFSVYWDWCNEGPVIFLDGDKSSESQEMKETKG